MKIAMRPEKSIIRKEERRKGRRDVKKDIT